MKLTEAQSKEELGQALDEVDQYIDGENGELKQRKFAGIMSWTASLAMHATVLLLVSLIVITQMEEPQEAPPTQVSYIAAPPHMDDKIKDKERVLIDKDIIESDIIHESDVDVKSALTNLDIPEDVKDSSEGEKDSDIPKGRQEAISDSEMGGMGNFPTIGVGGGSPGMWGNRTGDGKRRTKAKMGPFGPKGEFAIIS